MRRGIGRAAPMRSTASLVIVVALMVAGCGGSAEGESATTTPGAPRVKVQRIAVGRGETGATVVRPAGATGTPPVVIFLHGYQGIAPATYGAWLDHLAREGNVIIYPTYQTPITFPNRFLPNALVGIRAALARVPVQRETLVVAGHSAGGALSADYAAIAGAVGLPPARAVFAVYPGRELRGIPISIPAIDGSRIPATTDVTALAGARDTTVGTATAQAIIAGATRVPADRKRYELIRDPAVDMHLGPLTTGSAARRVFWDRLDRTIARVRHGG